MSRLDELIAKFCPNGVKYRELKDILIIKNGKDYKNLTEGKYPVYGSGGIMTYVSSYVYDKPSVLIPRKGSIDKLYYVEEPFWNVDTIFYTEIDEEKVIPRYVYFCLQKEHLEQYNTAGGVPSLTQKVLNRVKLPVPPLGSESGVCICNRRGVCHWTDQLRWCRIECGRCKFRYGRNNSGLFL